MSKRQRKANRENRAKVGTSANKENDRPGAFDIASERASRSKTTTIRDLERTRSALSDLTTSYTRLQTRCDTFQRTANHYKQRLHELRSGGSIDTGCHCNGAPTVSFGEYQAVCDVLEWHKRHLSFNRREVKRLNDTLRRERRDREKAIVKAVAEAKLIVVKEKGRVPHPVRSLIRDWSILCNVPSKRVFPCIRLFCKAFGLDLRGSFSHGLVGLCIEEGGMAARMQISAAILKAIGATMSNDGTSHRNQHFAAHHITVKMADGLVRTFNAGIKRVPSKSSEQQLGDWQNLLVEAWDVFNSSPLGSAEQVTAAVFLRILCGTTGDHASDQRKLNRLIFLWKQATDRLERGYDIIEALPDLQYQCLVAEVSMDRMEELGDTVWEDLSDAERDAHIRAGLDEVATRLGWESFNDLDPHAQASIDFFYHFGCEMHKELNTVVYGNKYLSDFWPTSGEPGPIPLPNKDVAAAAASATPSASRRAMDAIARGGAKFLALLGAYLRNKDSKKGCQRLFNTWMSADVGETVEFPDVARARFQSLCLAAGFVICHRERLTRFMELMRDSKDDPGFNNLEKNIYNALGDPYTLTDCAVLACYPHLVTIPYICDIRRPGVNALDLAPKHERVKEHCRALRDNPGLFLDVPLDRSHIRATLDGQPYHDINVMAEVLRRYHAGELPRFRDAFSAFMNGTAAGWDNFASEFDDDSVLATASASDLARSHADATNDRNEHSLGSLRRLMNLKPNATTETISTQIMYRDNGTDEYMATLTEATLDSLKSMARGKLDQCRGNPEGEVEIARLHELAAHNREKAAEAKRRLEEFNAKLDAFTSKRIQDPTLITKKLTMKQMEPELEWHRYRGLPDTHPDKIPKVKARLAKAEQQRAALKAAVTALLEWEAAGNQLQGAMEVPEEQLLEPEENIQSYSPMDIDAA